MKIESAPRRTAPRASAVVPASLRAFLAGLIDYAGLFPPARLPLEDALPNFAAYRESEDAWMLGRFICPAGRLADLDVYTDLFRPDHPFPVAVLGTGGGDADTFIEHLRRDLAAVRQFLDTHAGRVTADVLEVRLPDAVAEAGSPAVAVLLERVAEVVAESGLVFERLHFEVAFAGDWRGTVRGAVGALARHDALPVGFKLRCGGLAPNAFPTPEHVAFVLAACRDARLPFKATAGLHHPVRHYDRSLEVMRHGFLNVFGAAVLAHALELSEAALRQVLRSESPKAFTFDNAGFAFQDLRITTEQVVAAREALAISFGSCSFDEPREDLRQLGLL